MRVKTYRADAGGVGSYRLQWPVEALRAQGYDVEDCYGQSLKSVARDTEDGTEILAAVDPDCDVIVLQRTLRANMLALIPHLQALGVAVVLEIDDHFGALHRSNPAAGALQHSDPDGPTAEALLQACDLADLVTCTTPELAAYYAPHGRVRIIPNYVRADWLDIQHEPHDGPVRVGWTGIMDTHRKDHGTVLAPIRRVCDGEHVVFRAIGSKAVLDHYLLDSPPHEWQGWADLQTDDYSRAVGRLDVGIVPLQPGRFNEAKSWLKGIEYAACGVPFVASPTGPYRELSERYGIGLLARLPGEWSRHLERLVKSSTYREGMADRQRERMRRLTIEDHAHEWWDAWQVALNNRRGS